MIKTNNGHAALDGVKRRPKRNNSSTFLHRLSKRTLLTFLTLLLLTSFGSGQTTQQKTWIAGNKLLTFPSYPVSGNPEVTKTFDSVPNLYGAGSVGPVNVATDEAGNVLFYIRHFRVWNAQHQQVGQAGDMDRPSKWGGYYNVEGDLAIVPFIEQSGCMKRFYVFYQNQYQTAVVLNVMFVTVNVNTGEVSVVNNTASPVNLIQASIPVFGNGRSLRTGGLAVSPEVNGKRYLYFVSGYAAYKITITAPGVNYVNGYSPAQNLNVSTVGVRFYASQASLSMDGTKLAWGCYPDLSLAPVVYGSQYFIIGLDANGDWDNTSQTFNLPEALTGNSQYGCRGAVFNADASKLFVSTGKIGYGIYAIDIATSAYRLLPSSLDAGVSQLRLGNNGLIYCLEQTALKAYNPTTELLVSTLTGIITHNAYDSIQYLPNQINNEKRENILQLGIPMEITTSTTFDGDLIGNMKINKELAVYGTNTVLTIKNMTMEFSDGATLKLTDGTSLVLDNCTLKGMSLAGCNNYKRMWNGIVAASSGPLAPQIDITVGASFDNPTTIRDAKTGIALYGAKSRLSLLRNATFRANETHLAISYGAEIGNAESSTYIGDEVLLNQSLGDDNGYPDSLKRTKYGLYVSHSAIDVGYNANFTGGQYGIYAVYPTLGSSVNGSTFTWQKRSGVYIANTNVNAQAISIADNYFGYTNNGVRILNSLGVLFMVNRNTFDHVSYNGVDAFNNKSSRFHIGYDMLGSEFTTNKNTFTNSGAAAIYLHNNSNPDTTEIYIMHNIITSSTPASHGIIVSESSGGTNKYNALRIYRNTINNTARGIQMINAVGRNPNEPAENRLFNYPMSRITNNTIVLDTKQGSEGITTGGSARNSYLSNSISGNRYSKGANLVNSFATLYHGNESNTGYGMMAQGHMGHSNYYCNTFRKANYGMYLANHILRVNSGQTHGDFLTKARDNDFFTKPTSKPYHNICLDATSQLWNKWKFSSNFGIPSIVNITGGSTAIFAGYEASLCLTPDLSDTTNGDAQPGVQADVTGALAIFWNEYGNQQGFKMSYDSIGSADSNVVRLIDAEDLLAEGYFTAALGRINSIVITPSAPDETIMSDYKLLYQTYIAYRMQDTIGRTMNDSMVAILTTIAEKNPVTTSPASHSAQAILWHERMLTFDHTPVPSLVLTGFVSTNCALPDMESIPAFLVDENGQVAEGPVYTDSDGQFAFDGGIVSTYSNDFNLYKIRMILTDGTILETGAATVAELSLASDHEMDCGNAIAPLIISGLIHPDGCPLQVTSNIMAYLLKQNDEVVEGPVMVNSAGTFSFDPMLTALHHNNDLYKIKLVFANATTATTNPETIAELAAGSVHEFNCPDEPPIILPKKGNDKEPLKYKEQVNEFEKQVPFSISPNPSNGIFTIKGGASGATATLTNLLGQIIMKDLPLTNGLVDASRIKAGVYLLTVTDKHNTYVQKINIIK